SQPSSFSSCSLHAALPISGNHLTFIDSMVLPLVCDRQVFFIGKDEYVTGKGLKGRLMAWFFTGVGMIPVDRDGGRGGVAALMTRSEEHTSELQSRENLVCR